MEYAGVIQIGGQAQIVQVEELISALRDSIDIETNLDTIFDEYSIEFKIKGENGWVTRGEVENLRKIVRERSFSSFAISAGTLYSDGQRIDVNTGQAVSLIDDLAGS